MVLANEYKTYKMFSEALDMTPSYFSQIRTKRKKIGDDIARRVEEKLNLSHGYIDILHDQPPKIKPQPDALPVNVSLVGLSDLQRGCLIRLEKLMRAAKVSDDDCLELMMTWKTKYPA